MKELSVVMLSDAAAEPPFLAYIIKSSAMLTLSRPMRSDLSYVVVVVAVVLAIAMM